MEDFCENRNSEVSNRFDNFQDAVQLAGQQNGWFTEENIMHAIRQWALLLTEDNLTQWLSKYVLPKDSKPKTIGIIMAGNIPLVGFHDFLCVLLSGNSVLAKLSSNDKTLMPFIAEHIMQLEPTLKDRISFTEGRLEDFDAIIATGSNNTSRYFEYYFGKRPNIIRKNRNSVAILTGHETQEQLLALGEDVFRYFGLGCRNVSKIFVPKGYAFEPFFNAFFSYKDTINHHKYANNYDYNKAVYLMSDFKILYNGFLILKEDESFSSPIATLFYSHYDSEDALRQKLEGQMEFIQCVVSNGKYANDVPFGETQKPRLNDYADGVDTMDFLLRI
ncbi:acyl-CoA reductase [Flagellimonas meishanensis]|uniref:acyl-CoA reductase n=1 Tax=Flagellimonas meishanensis TaxID=2873264 RepID=UPI00223B0C80|nr:acyl-CoA reductase [[Muricauda] meishanensis]